MGWAVPRTLDHASNANGCLEGAAASGGVELLALLLGLASGAQPTGVPISTLACIPLQTIASSKLQ
jgi:hypothetical protein